MDYRRHIRLVLFAALVQGCFYLRNILLLPVLTRALGPELYGIWSKLHALSNLLAPVLALGMVEALERFLPVAGLRTRQRCFRDAALVTAAGALAVVIGCYLAAPLLVPWLALQSAREPMTRLLLAGAGLVIGVNACNRLCMTYLRACDLPRRYGLYVVAQLVLMLGVAFLAWHLLGRTQWVAIGAWSLGPGLPALLCALLLLRGGEQPAAGMPDSRPRRGRATPGPDLADLVRYGAPLAPMAMLTWIMHTSDRYLLVWLNQDLDNRAVGVYSANYAFAGVAAMVCAPLWVFFVPTIARLWDSGRRAQARHLARQTAKYCLLLVCPLLLACPVFARQGMRLVTGTRSFQAHWVIMLLVMLGYLLHLLGDIVQAGFAMKKVSARILLNTLAAAGVNVLLNCLLVPLPGTGGGLTGAAIATAAGFAVYLLLGCVGHAAEPGLDPGWEGLARVAAAGLAGAACAEMVARAGGYGAPASLAAGLLAYGLGLLAFTAVRPGELRVAWEAVRGGGVFRSDDG